MRGFIIDAGIAVKWVVEEPGTKEALALRACPLGAPELLVAECANILWKKARRRELTIKEAGVAATLLERADIELHPMRLLVTAATEMAIALDHPAYDCLYLALAKARGLRFVTADQRLIGRVAEDRSGRFAGLVLSLADAAAAIRAA